MLSNEVVSLLMEALKIAWCSSWSEEVGHGWPLLIKIPGVITNWFPYLNWQTFLAFTGDAVKRGIRNNGITFSENALNFADTARAIGIQQGNSATVEDTEQAVALQPELRSAVIPIAYMKV